MSCPCSSSTTGWLCCCQQHLAFFLDCQHCCFFHEIWSRVASTLSCLDCFKESYSWNTCRAYAHFIWHPFQPHYLHLRALSSLQAVPTAPPPKNPGFGCTDLSIESETACLSGTLAASSCTPPLWFTLHFPGRTYVISSMKRLISLWFSAVVPASSIPISRCWVPPVDPTREYWLAPDCPRGHLRHPTGGFSWMSCFFFWWYWNSNWFKRGDSPLFKIVFAAIYAFTLGL